MDVIAFLQAAAGGVAKASDGDWAGAEMELHEAERLAKARGRTLLTLDTATEEGASALYERLGFTFAGEIPDYALKPHGGLTGTRIYWKRIGV